MDYSSQLEDPWPLLRHVKANLPGKRRAGFPKSGRRLWNVITALDRPEGFYTGCLITAYWSNTCTYIHTHTYTHANTHRVARYVCVRVHTSTNKAKSPIMKHMKPFLLKATAEWRIKDSFLSNWVFKRTCSLKPAVQRAHTHTHKHKIGCSLVT